MSSWRSSWRNSWSSSWSSSYVAHEHVHHLLSDRRCLGARQQQDDLHDALDGGHGRLEATKLLSCVLTTTLLHELDDVYHIISGWCPIGLADARHVLDITSQGQSQLASHHGRLRANRRPLCWPGWCRGRSGALLGRHGRRSCRCPLLWCHRGRGCEDANASGSDASAQFGQYCATHGFPNQLSDYPVHQAPRGRRAAWRGLPQIYEQLRVSAKNKNQMREGACMPTRDNQPPQTKLSGGLIVVSGAGRHPSGMPQLKCECHSHSRIHRPHVSEGYSREAVACAGGHINP